MEIPGYYYDESKRKYFKITKNAGASSKYSSEAIKKERKEDERSKKRARIGNNSPNKVPFINLEGSIISNRTNQFNTADVRLKIQEYKISRLQLEGFMKTRANLNSDVFKRISCNDKTMVLSSLNNVYQIPLETLQFNTNEDLFPLLKVHRVDKVHSILRNMITIKAPMKPLIRAWFGAMNEPSEIELTIEASDLTTITKSKVLSSKFESFNNSIYNEKNNSIVICGNKNVSRFDATLTSPDIRRDIIFQGADVLAIDSIDENTYHLGLRNGKSGIVDDRVHSKDSHNIKKCMDSSIINIKGLEGHRVLCSSLGSKIKLFDTRIGFNKSLIDYQSTKDVGDVFGERLEIIEGNMVMVQNKSLCEFFNYNIPTPIKTMDFGNNERITDICFYPGARDDQFYVTNGKEIGFMN